MSVLSIGLSGLQAASAQLNVAANNIANSETPNYKSQRVDLVDLSTGGVAVSGISVDKSAGPIEPDGTHGSNEDPVTDAINLTRTKLLYSANAAAVRIGQQVSGGLLDILDTDRDGDKS